MSTSTVRFGLMGLLAVSVVVAAINPTDGTSPFVRWVVIASGAAGFFFLLFFVDRTGSDVERRK